MTARTIRRANSCAREDRRLDAMRQQAVFKPDTAFPLRPGWRNYSRRFNRYQLRTLQPRAGRF